MRWALTSIASFVAFASIVSVGCTPPCASDEVSVRKSGGGSTCVPTDRDSDSEGSPIGPSEPYEPYGSVTIPPGTSAPPASGTSDAGPGDACRTEDAGDLTVHVVAKGGAPPSVAVSAPLDGRYALVQATFFAAETGAPSSSPGVSALRAEVVVQGALWIFGARAVDGKSIGLLESTTLSVVADTATNVCATSPGSVASSFFPEIGATTRATASWDGGASTLTIVLETPKGANVELVFVRD